MSKDLLERLRHQADEARKNYPEVFRVSEEIAYEAADYIEKLEAANLKQSCIKVDDQMRIEKLEAALRFYANDENYRQVWDDQFRTWVTYVLSDNGRIARKALEGKDG